MLATLADAAVDQSAPRLRAEVRRHPSASSKCFLARNGAGSSHLVPPRQREDDAVPVDRARARNGGGAPASAAAPRRRDRRARRAGPSGRVPAASGTHPPQRSAPTSARVDHAQPVALILFDLLRDGDDDVRGLPLTERRARLEAHFGTLTSETIRLSEQAVGDGRALQARAQGRRLGRPDRQGGAVALPVRQAQPGVAQAEDPARTGVRRRRLDRAAADAPALRRAAARACTKATVDRRPPTADWFTSVTREPASTGGAHARLAAAEGARDRRVAVLDAPANERTSTLGAARARGAGPLHRVDRRQQAAASRLPRAARRQGAAHGCPRGDSSRLAT